MLEKFLITAPKLKEDFHRGCVISGCNFSAFSRLTLSGPKSPKVDPNWRSSTFVNPDFDCPWLIFRHRLVPLERMGLHSTQVADDDQTKDVCREQQRQEGCYRGRQEQKLNTMPWSESEWMNVSLIHHTHPEYGPHFFYVAPIPRIRIILQTE
jgi:hypothetical protein